MSTNMAKSMSGFGARLRELRAAAGLTQSDLAAKADLNIGTFTKIEQGVNEPNWLTVLALARALDVSADDFRSDTEPAAKKKPRKKRK